MARRRRVVQTPEQKRNQLERAWDNMATHDGTSHTVDHYAGFGVCAGCGATDRYRRGKGPDTMRCRECFTTP